MKTAVILLGSAGLMLAESWTGKLVDANCKPEPNAPANAKGELPSSCIATASTTSFGIETSDGKIYKLDAAGNAKAMQMVKTPEANKKDTVKVSGSLEGQMVKVDSIDFR